MKKRLTVFATISVFVIAASVAGYVFFGLHAEPQKLSDRLKSYISVCSDSAKTAEDRLAELGDQISAALGGEAYGRQQITAAQERYMRENPDITYTVVTLDESVDADRELYTDDPLYAAIQGRFCSFLTREYGALDFYAIDQQTLDQYSAYFSSEESESYADFIFYNNILNFYMVKMVDGGGMPVASINAILPLSGSNGFADDMAPIVDDVFVTSHDSYYSIFGPRYGETGNLQDLAAQYPGTPDDVNALYAETVPSAPMIHRDGKLYIYADILLDGFCEHHSAFVVVDEKKLAELYLRKSLFFAVPLAVLVLAVCVLTFLFNATHKAYTDSLTGLYNRQYLSKLPQKCRADAPLCIVISDLDNFKRINDTYTHLAGDEVLKRFADIIRQAIRKQDKVIRFGGEEVVIYMADTSLENAVLIAERIRRSVEETVVMFEGEAIQFTASFGVAGSNDSATTMGKLLEIADIKLLEAKSRSKNVVCW